MIDIKIKYLSLNQVEVCIDNGKDDRLTSEANEMLKNSIAYADNWSAVCTWIDGYKLFEHGFYSRLIDEYGFKNFRLTIEA